MFDYVLGIDPGDKHVGLARWARGDAGVDCSEVHADMAYHEVDAILIEAIDGGYQPVVAIESFQLYEDKALAQSGSGMLTSQMIGGIKYIAQGMGVPVVEQGALIKAATRAQLRARGIKLTGSIHARDAGLHCAHFVLFNHLGLRDSIPASQSG